MATLTETVHGAEFILSVDNYNRCVQQVTIVSGQNLKAGQVIAKVTASGKYATYDNDLSNGTETATGVLVGDIDASSADKTGVMLEADAEVKGATLTWKDAGATTAGTPQLLALGIKIRS